jgi:hypothetical protein
LGNIERAKVFAKVKNGQKKCPILENPGILPKSKFPKMNLDHNAHNAKNLIQKVLAYFFCIFWY